MSAQQQVQLMPRQVTYPTVLHEVFDQERGERVLVFHAFGEDLVFPLGADQASDLAKKLISTRIEVPQPGGFRG